MERTGYMIIAVSNQKGGVSKTTSAFNIGACLVKQHNKRVLLVDNDPQANLSEYLKYEPDGKPTITNLIMDLCMNRPLTEDYIRSAIRHSEATGVDYIPSDINLASSEVLMSTVISRETLLKKVLIESITAEYDYILIDCLPSLGTLLINALTVADKVLIPVQTQKFALDGLQALDNLYKQVQSAINTRLDLLGVLPTMADNTNVSKKSIDALKEQYGDKVFNACLSKSVEAAKSAESGIPLCTSSTKLGKEYKAFVVEMLSRTEGVKD